MRTPSAVIFACALAFQPLAAFSQQVPLEELGFGKEAVQGDAQHQALLDKRSHMLKVHQTLGLVTLAPMAGALFTGEKAKEGGASGRNLHAALGMTAAAMYFTTAYFSLRAPVVDRKPARGATKVHKALAFVHFPAMLAVPVLGMIAYDQRKHGETAHGAAKYHSAVAGTAAGAFALSMLTMTIKF